MPGLASGIHVFVALIRSDCKTWVTGTSPVTGIFKVSLLERQQALSALLAAVMALFVASGYAPLARWRRRLRAAAIVVFLIALAAALAEVGWWLAGAQP